MFQNLEVHSDDKAVVCCKEINNSIENQLIKITKVVILTLVIFVTDDMKIHYCENMLNVFYNKLLYKCSKSVESVLQKKT